MKAKAIEEYLLERSDFLLLIFVPVPEVPIKKKKKNAVASATDGTGGPARPLPGQELFLFPRPPSFPLSRRGAEAC